VADGIKAQYPETRIRTVVYDYSKLVTLENVQDYQKLILDNIKDLDVSVVVNNVGIAQEGTVDQHSP